MKKNRKYWKETAKSVLRGNWGIAIAGMLAYMAVNFLGNILSLELFPGNSMMEIAAGQIFVFVVSLIAMVFGTGYSYMMLNMSRGREFSLGNLLYMFHNQPDRVLIAAFVMALLNTVSQIPVYLAAYLTEPGSTLQAEMNWMYMIMGVMLLSVVLYVLVTVPFALSFYLLADNPQMGGVESLKESRRLMKGHIWQYLMLQLSFAPMLIVSLLLMGLPLLWVLPYMEASETAFYRDILGEFDEPKQEEVTYRNASSDDYNAEA
nr:DUF975 family protein [uncultured Blautia sp.]